MDFEVDCNAALQVAARLAREAGELVLEGWRAGGPIDRKGRIDLVTEYDLRSEQLIRAGVVHAPALGTSWTAVTGSGAHRNGERCSVSTRAQMEEALCATGFPYDRWTNPDNNEREFSHFLKKTRGIRRCGSAALDLAMLADGTYDLYWEQSLRAWDMCAGALLVAEAGGRLSDYDGAPADPRSGRLVASNGLLHEQALRTLAEAREGLDADKR